MGDATQDVGDYMFGYATRVSTEPQHSAAARHTSVNATLKHTCVF